MIPAPVQDVFDAWTKPELLALWSAPEGIEHISYELDLRVGGSYTLKMTSPEGGFHTAHGKYLEINAPNRLVYTWDWKEDDYRMDVDTVITVEFIAVGDATEVLLTHDRFPAEEAVQGHNEGWTSCLDRLEALLA